MLASPAFQRKLESYYNKKSDIPAYYYTNLPMHPEEEPRACGPDQGRLCDTWLAGEPLICSMLMITAMALLLVAYYRRGHHPQEPSLDQVPLLSEKYSFQLAV